MRHLISLMLATATLSLGCGAETGAAPITRPGDGRDLSDDASDMSDSPDSPRDEDLPADPPDMRADADLATEVTPNPRSEDCTQSAEVVACAYETLQVEYGILDRDVHYQLPTGSPPEGGWPVVLFFQGSFFSSERGWSAEDDTAYGGYYQAELFKELLDHGFAVLAPEARFNGSTYWDTNIWPWSFSWESSGDHDLMLAIFDAIEDGSFGPLNDSRMYATGISSGGYMTSRMAVSYRGRFTALAITAASYATCAGFNCSVPDLPERHPPTFFVHGERDNVVPIRTMREYAEDLDEAGFQTGQFVDEEAGHEWPAGSPQMIRDWFLEHP